MLRTFLSTRLGSLKIPVLLVRSDFLGNISLLLLGSVVCPFLCGPPTFPSTVNLASPCRPSLHGFFFHQILLFLVHIWVEVSDLFSYLGAFFMINRGGNSVFDRLLGCAPARVCAVYHFFSKFFFSPFEPLTCL